MVSGVAQIPNLGFDRLKLAGAEEQRRHAAFGFKPEATPTVEGEQGTSPAALPPEQQRQIDALAAVDRRVKAHEQAHMSVGADLVRGGPNYSYTTGPDGKRYAVAGEVRIDTSKGRAPEETIPKAQHIRATALAPADPSAQDRQVAALAARMEMEARQELALEERAPRHSARQAVAAYEAMGGEAQSSGFRTYA